jgi:hypothetical protein
MTFMAFRLFVYIVLYVFVVRNMTWAKPISSPIGVDWNMLGHSSTNPILYDGDLVTLGKFHLGNCTHAYIDYNTCMSGKIPSSHCYRRQRRCPTGWMVTKDIAWESHNRCNVFQWSWYCSSTPL